MFLSREASSFLGSTAWSGAGCEPLSGDASVRRYFRLRKDGRTAVLMDASQNRDTVPAFVRIGDHLRQLGFSAPTILEQDQAAGILVLEDFGDDTFARLLDRRASSPEGLFTLATDVLIALHGHPQAVPAHSQCYDAERMLEDVELFLDWPAAAVSESAKAEFRAAWREVLPSAHRVPATLLLRDYHAANLMLLPGREGVRKAGLLDFQDAYRGPITYDLVSLLEDARRDVPEPLADLLTRRYLAQFPALDAEAFSVSRAIVAAQRHTRVLAIFERLSRHEGRHEYRRLHSSRVEHLLRKALKHPALEPVTHWMDHHAR